MAIELPPPVADFLSFIGIPWVNLNEDKVREFSQNVKTFASDVADVHGNATSTLSQLGSGYMEGLLLGGGGGGGSAGPGFTVDNEHLDAHASKMQGHADELAGHVQKFTSNVASLDFGS